MNILFLDTETSGLDTGKHQLMQICAVLKDVHGVVLKSFNEYIGLEYGKEQSMEALKVNNLIFTTDYQTLKKKEREVAGDFLMFIADLPKNTVVCGHGVQFDINFLKKMFNNYGITNMEAYIGRKFLDTGTIALLMKDCEIVDFKGYSLATVAETLEIPFKKEELHNARVDVELTSKVYYKMKEILKATKSNTEAKGTEDKSITVTV